MKYEVATILKDHIKELKVSSHQYKVLYHIMNCRTKEMGQHIKKCTNKSCNHTEIINNSCQDRNCPKCQGDKQIRWKSKRLKELLPVTYSHIVFLIPRILYVIFQYNQSKCYNLLFKVLSKTIKEFSNKTGYYTTFHTWTQKGNYHPHIHCVVPEIENGLKPKRFVLKKEILNIVYKRILLKNILLEIRKGSLNLLEIKREKIISSLKNSKNYINLTTNIKDVARLIDYLGNNTNRVGMADYRIKDYDWKSVTYSYIDRSDGHKVKDIKLDVLLFIKRYVLHILPAKFTKQRYYGFLSNNCKKQLKHIKEYLLELKNEIKSSINENVICIILKLIEELNTPEKCNYCGVGLLQFNRFIKPRTGL